MTVVVCNIIITPRHPYKRTDDMAAKRWAALRDGGRVEGRVVHRVRDKVLQRRELVGEVQRRKRRQVDDDRRRVEGGEGRRHASGGAHLDRRNDGRENDDRDRGETSWRSRERHLESYGRTTARGLVVAESRVRHTVAVDRQRDRHLATRVSEAGKQRQQGESHKDRGAHRDGGEEREIDTRTRRLLLWWWLLGVDRERGRQQQRR